MKRIISLLITLFVSLFNGVSFESIGDVPFMEDQYYTLDMAEAPDYREIYGSNPIGGNQSNCERAFYNGHSSKVTDDSGKALVGYSVDESKTMKLSDSFMSDVTYTFTSNAKIIAPYDGFVETPFEGNNGHHMVIKCETKDDAFTLSIDNMDRWWCCHNKLHEDAVDSDGNAVWIHTLKDSDKKVKFKQGQVIGYAQSGTNITVTQSSRNSNTWHDFYNISTDS